MSLRSGGPTRKGPAHKNEFAFRHNKHSKKTAKIYALSNVGLCQRCTDIIEWRKKYRKYKPLKGMGFCAYCHERNVKYAYHTICFDCSHARGDICPKCLEKKDLIREEHLLTEDMIRTLMIRNEIKERKRRTIMRKWESGEYTDDEIRAMIEGEGEEQANGGGEKGEDEDDGADDENGESEQDGDGEGDEDEEDEEFEDDEDEDDTPQQDDDKQSVSHRVRPSAEELAERKAKAAREQAAANQAAEAEMIRQHRAKMAAKKAAKTATASVAPVSHASSTSTSTFTSTATATATSSTPNPTSVPVTAPTITTSSSSSSSSKPVTDDERRKLEEELFS